LDLVARHPSTATFIATKLARRFVADDPPPALIARAAETFKTTGGNLREVTRTILMSPEMVSPEARRSKVKTPLEFVASALRASGAEVKDAGSLLGSLREMGMPLYFAQPPTGYVDSAEPWTNSGALLSRMNLAVALVNQRLLGVTVDLFRVWGGADLDATRRRLLEQVLQGEASQATQATLAKASDVPQLAALTLGSPEFQRR
jgi:uncharacterized protein (DUF1800 family)